MRVLSFLAFLPLVASYIKGYSFYGHETESFKPVCFWVKPPDYYVKFLKDLGFNYVRIPFSLEYVERGDWESLDNMLALTYTLNVSVLLDFHRIFAQHQDYDPFQHGVTHERFINGWLAVLNRYALYTNIFATNVYNEYQGSNHTFLNGYSEEVVLAIEAVFPNRFHYHITGTNWAGSSHLVSLEHLPFHDRIYYSLHKYVFSSNGDYENDWVRSCGNHTGKIVIGETGWLDKDAWWGELFISWLKKNKILDVFFWTISVSDGTGGLWDDDCLTFNWNKYNILNKLWEGEKRKLRSK